MSAGDSVAGSRDNGQDGAGRGIGPPINSGQTQKHVEQELPVAGAEEALGLETAFPGLIAAEEVEGDAAETGEVLGAMSLTFIMLVYWIVCEPHLREQHQSRAAKDRDTMC